MKKGILLVLLIVICCGSYSQSSPSLEETIDYIEARMRIKNQYDKESWSWERSNYRFRIDKAMKTINITYGQYGFHERRGTQRTKNTVVLYLNNCSFKTYSSFIKVTPKDSRRKLGTTTKKGTLILGSSGSEISIDDKDNIDSYYLYVTSSAEEEKVGKALKHLQSLYGIKDDSDMF